MVIRSARPEDAAPLSALWRAAGLRFRAEHVDRELRSVLARDSDLVIVAEEPGGVLTGSVFGTFDGRRGWVNRLATRPGHRGQGLATALIGEFERRLLANGCAKVNLLIEPDNAGVAGFYERHGYQRDDLIFMEKWLTDDGAPEAS